MADKLTLYNTSLHYLGERKLASLSENREPRRILDDFYPDVVAYCLARKFWNFSYRAVSIDASTTVIPSFGFLHAFTIPTDWIRTHLLSAVPTFDPPLFQMREEAGYWYADLTPLYVQYNSNDPLYGMNLGAWPPEFTDYVGLRLARQTCRKITGSDEALKGPDGLIKREKDSYKVAAANVAMNDAIGFAPQSSWVRARRGFVTNMPGSGSDDPTGGALIP